MLVPSSSFDDIQVSYFKYFKGGPSLDICVSRVFAGIRSDVFKETVLNVRKYKVVDIKLSKQYKASLPAVTFCCTFKEKRNLECCVHYNNLMVIDIDHIETNQMEWFAKCLKVDPYVAAFWRSPSGNGYKGLVHLVYDEKVDALSLKIKHKVAFRQLLKYLLVNYGMALDESGSDIPRLCYMCWDPDILVKDEAAAFHVGNEDLEDFVPKKSNGVDREHESKKPAPELNWNMIIGKANYPLSNHYRCLLGNIYKKLVKKNASITESYANWVKVAFAIASNIHPVKGKELFLKLCSLDGSRNDEQKSERLIFEAYAKTNNEVSFGTIIYLAREKGLNINTKGGSSNRG